MDIQDIVNKKIKQEKQLTTSEIIIRRIKRELYSANYISDKIIEHYIGQHKNEPHKLLQFYNTMKESFHKEEENEYRD